jgi:hypothetical protein
VAVFELRVRVLQSFYTHFITAPRTFPLLGFLQDCADKIMNKGQRKDNPFQ